MSKAPRATRFFAEDIIGVIELLKTWSNEAPATSDTERWRSQFARERALGIISEACRGLPAAAKAKRPSVSWRSIEDFGNALRHGYHELDQRRLDAIVASDLETLRLAVLDMMDELD